MNRTYALVWNHCLGAWSVADEHARRCGKGAGAVLAAALLLPGLALAADLPTGGNIVSGSGQIDTPNGNQMVIDQDSNKLAIDWQSFDIAAGHKVTFNQPGSQSIALNRVLGADGSKIMGQLDANGRVFIVNPNGVLFGAGASVNVGGLVASTLDLSVSDFEAGNYQFKGNGNNASVINNGQITAADGGSIALLGGTVSNNGVIVANQGTVALAAGNKVTLDFAGDGLLNVQVDEALVDALVENHQLIRADGGQVLLTAHAGEALLKTVVNNTGVIEARTLGEKDGKIVLLGDFAGGTVSVAGTLDASAPTGGDGGFIDTSGAHVKVADGAKVTTLAQSGTTGTWLIDPTDFTVSAGDAAQSDSGIGASTLSKNLNSTSITLQTVATDNGADKGDIHVNAAVTWDKDTTLTLSAHNDIHINASITAKHANGKLALHYGQGSAAGGDADYAINMSNGASVNLQSGQNFATQKGSSGSLTTYTVVNDANALKTAMAGNGNYALGSHLDLTGVTWGNYSLVGKFDGLGHTLSNLSVTSSSGYAGLFMEIHQGADLRHIGLVNANITSTSGSSNYVGGLAGLSHGSIRRAYVTGQISNNSFASGGSSGGLVGWNDSGSISDSYSTAEVTLSSSGGLGASYVGGLVGYNGNGGSIRRSYATGKVSATSPGGSSYAGGLVGLNGNGSIDQTYATGNVTSSWGGMESNVGGLVGSNISQGGNISISQAYATGNVTSSGGAMNSSVGGLVGTNSSQGGNISISQAYATGNVTSSGGGMNSSMGGLVGSNISQLSGIISISHAYTTGNVTSSGGRMESNVGGLVGFNSSQQDGSNISISQAYATGNVTSAGGHVGGLVGNNMSQIGGSTSITDSFWNTTTTGQGGSAGGGTGKTTAEMQLAATYDGWDFGSTWRIATTGAGTDGYAFYGLPTLQGVTRKTDYQYFDSGLGTQASPWTLTNWQQLQNINAVIEQTSGKYFALNGYTTNASATANGGAGWKPLGDDHTNSSASRFTGQFDGQYHTIGDLVANVTTPSYNDGSASSSHAGLFGVLGSGAQVSKLGLVNATVSASGGTTNFAGALAGVNDGGTITQSYASGNVSAAGAGYVGVLAGYNTGAIHSSYASGSASGTYAGVLAGYNTGAIDSSYASGALTSNNGGNVTRSFYDSAAAGISGTGKTAAELKQASTFADWDISANGGENTAWRIYEGQTGPLLRGFLKQITVTADAGNITGDKTYNGTTISGTASYTTSTPGAALDGSLGYATNSKNAGTYSTADGSLTIGGLYSGQQGYDISYASTPATLTIDKAALTVTAHNASKTYDGLAFSGGNGVSYNGFVNGETEAVLGGALAYGGTAQGAINAGSYGLSASGLTADNYTLSYTDGSLTVDKASLTVTAHNASKTYDGQAFSGGNGVSYNGFVNNETETVLGGTLAYSGSAQDAVNAGTYGLSASGLSADNYTLSYTDGSLTVDKASLTVTANNASKTYDGQAFSGGNGVNYNGFVNGETETVLGGTLIYGGSAQGAVNAGTYGLSASGLTADNYTLSYTDGSLTVDKASLTVTANNASKTYDGQAFSGGNGVSYNGFVNGETETVLGGTLTYGGSAQGAVNAGTYGLSASGLSANNYDIQYEDGTLQVTAAAVAPPPPNANSTTLPYASVLASNGQTVSAESKQQAQEPEALSQDMLVTNPLDERMNLQVINHGIRLPEGI